MEVSNHITFSQGLAHGDRGWTRLTQEENVSIGPGVFQLLFGGHCKDCKYLKKEEYNTVFFSFVKLGNTLKYNKIGPNCAMAV